MNNNKAGRVMNSILDKNIKAIKKQHSEIEINWKIVDELLMIEDIDAIESYDGYMIKSQIDQEQAIEVWCEQFANLKINSIVVVFGVGSIRYYTEFRKLYPNIDIVIYHPCEEIFYNDLASNDYADFLEKRGSAICVGEAAYKTFLTALGTAMGYESIRTPYFAKTPNSDKIFEIEYDKYEEEVIKSFRQNTLDRNTVVAYKGHMLHNYAVNLKRLVYESTVIEIKEEFDKHPEIKNYPAIILSAGPSLDGNILDIKDVKGRAFIICVDAAVKTCVRNNIRPDIIVSVDPDYGKEPLDNELGRELSLLTHIHGADDLLEVNNGRKFFLSGRDDYLEYIFDKVFENKKQAIPILPTGGSVAHIAFSFAQILGFDKIILMGQDCGFPNNKMHAADAFEDEDDADENDEQYFYVDGIDGGKILTRIDMNVYREWFEAKIKTTKDITVVDATEGGALIHGSEVLTIREAIEKYCPKERIDFEGIINSSKELFESEAEKKKAIKEISRTFEAIDDNIDYLNKVKRDYYKLREANEKKKYNTKEFKRLFEMVTEHNKRFEEDRDMLLYEKFRGEKYFDALQGLRIVHDDEYKDIKNLVNQSIIMIDENIKVARDLKKEWEKVQGEKWEK